MKTTMFHLPIKVRLTEGVCAVVASVLLAGCTTKTHMAPVEDRMPRVTAAAPADAGAIGAGGTGSTGVAGAPSVAASAAAGTPTVGLVPATGASAVEGTAVPTTAGPRPNAEFAGQPGYYTVKVGDTLLRIGLETGQNWRDIARWNNLENPNVLEVGHVLRVWPPASEIGAATTRPVAPAPRIESRPLDARTPASAPASAPLPSPSPSPAPAPMPLPPAPAPAPTPTPAVVPNGAVALPSTTAPREAEGDISWAWPASGPVTTPFDDVRSKGVAIAGKAGDPVLAAADGRVVYAGSGLRGYGNLVIVKHNATYLTAYAHNQALLVKEDQVVRRGQKIAEMGSSDTDRVQLHFEVRRLGKPVDPARVLPPR